MREIELHSLFQPFLDQLRGQSVRNRELYSERLSGFLRLYGHKMPAELSRADVNEWLKALRARGLAPATLAGYRQAIKAFLRFACGLNHPADHVKTGSFISRRRKLPPITAVDAMANLAWQWTWRAAYPRLVRDGAIFMLALTSGPRGGEIRRLGLSETRAALDAGPDKFGVYRVRSIGKTGEITIAFPTVTASALVRWIEVRPTMARVDRLFVTTRKTMVAMDTQRRFRPLSRSAFDAVFVDLGKAAGVRPVRCHALRHRLGDLLTKQFSPKVAAMMLNHADADTAATAIAFYHHPGEEDLSQALASVSADLEIDKELNQLFRPD